MSNQSVWDNHYTRDRSRQQFPDENVVRLLRKNFAGERRTLALDLGTGSGRHLPLLVEHFENVLACDFSRESLRIAAGDKIQCAQAALPALPFASGTFDFILCWGVLHYLEESALAPAIAAIHEILKPGAGLFLTLRSDQDSHLALQLQRGDLAGGHARLYSKEEALSLFGRFAKVDYGFIARQPLGEEGLVAHHMLFARR
ncbi:MAG TPA: class I SAM-dependent methyltransferase [Turneriella sp.]|nr:class I SAM-dependent methyltransferase [Turneriella sp.]HNE19414.1 class I SAM-dependent methyltransferase [Turneriella sp.]HNJ65585.1 class I SAM-dependent methyltransferase [Turneriella sp.]HNL52992.1 class I SAM-dependent methyltransferase [Turneriella sp.]